MQDIDHPDASSNHASIPRYVVSKHSSMDYAWDYPAAREKKLVLAVNNTRRIVDVMEIGDLIPFKFAVCPIRAHFVYVDADCTFRTSKGLERSRWTCVRRPTSKSYGSRDMILKSVFTSRGDAHRLHLYDKKASLAVKKLSRLFRTKSLRI